MELIPIPLERSGLRLIKPRIFEDARGYFFESFSEKTFTEKVEKIHFCQDNQSLSRRGTLRGLHYQLEPKAQTKLVRVVEGSIWDVAVDIRRSSSTFGLWFGVELSDENNLQLLVPKGFAHGFLVLSERAVVQYKVDEYYSKDHERGIRFDDEDLKIEWPQKNGLILSSKDEVLPKFKDAEVFE